MLTLALDTALQSCSVAILKDEEVRARAYLPLVKGHAEVLPPMAARVLEMAGVRTADLDRVGVTVGPGGFTGVRVGLAFARALVLGVKAKAVGVGTMAALMASLRLTGASEDGFIAPVLDARRGDVFAALYRDGAPVIDAFCDAPENARDRLAAAADGAPITVIAGGGALLAAPANWRRVAEDLQIDPEALARLAAAAPIPVGPPAPVYLRSPDAKPGAPSIFDRIAKG